MDSYYVVVVVVVVVVVAAAAAAATYSYFTVYPNANKLVKIAVIIAVESGAAAQNSAAVLFAADYNAIRLTNASFILHDIIRVYSYIS
jgi:hypothetical protein